jgi:hypothetical protein
MARKLILIAVAGIGLGIVSIAAAAVVAGPDLSKIDWENLNIGFDRCEKVDGATATSRTLDWTGGDRITIAVPGEAHYRPGDNQAIQVSGDPNSIAHLRLRHHTLEFDCNGLHRGKLDITLPGRTFRSFAVAGSGNLTLEQIDQPSLDVTVAGSGTVKSSGKADQIKIKIAGSGTIEASGQADTVDLVIAGSGDARLGELQAKIADINIAGSGDAEVAPQDIAKIKIAGSGNVRLVTNPKDLDTRIFGSGRILHGPAGSVEDRP